MKKQFTRHFPNIAPPKTVLNGRFEGVVTNIMRRYEEKSSFSAKQRLEKYLIQQKCPDCNGVRFRSEVLEVRILGVNILEALSMSLEEMNDWLEKMVSQLSPQELNVLFKLRDMGNTVIVIEHDLELMKAADYLVDFGPGAGKNSGNIVAAGTVEDIIACEDSVTGKYLNGYQGFHREKVMGNGKSIKIIHANHSNLKDLELDIL